MAKISKKIVDSISPPQVGQQILWDSELRGFGVRTLPSGLKSFILQYRNSEGQSRRVKLGRFGVMTVEQARDDARIKLGMIAAGKDPAAERVQGRDDIRIANLCDWYLLEARAGRILGRLNRPIKTSSLYMDESRIETHIKPLIGKRVARKLTIADVETMQADILNGKTAKARKGGRGGKASGGPAVAARTVGTLQAILGHAKHKGLITEHPTRGAKKLTGKKKTRRLSIIEIENLGKAMAYAEAQAENPTGLAIIKTLILTGYRREEAQAMHRSWINSIGTFVAFPDTKGGTQVRAIGTAAVKILSAQPVISGNPHVFPSTLGEGPFTAVSDCLQRVCRMAGISGVTPHTLRHTFGSVAGDLGFSELTIRAMLGHASQNITQDYVHIDEALKLAVERTSGKIACLLEIGASKFNSVHSTV